MAKLTVLGIGNLLMRDDGVGVCLLQAVEAARDWGDDVEFIDGGAGGLNLLNVIERAERLVVFDAAEMALPPGKHRVITPDQVVEETTAGRVSMHDMPFMETLKLCEQFTHSPSYVRIFVVQPATVDYGRELSEPLAAAMGKLVSAAMALVIDECRQIGLEF